MKFAICSSLRTGCHALASALDQHTKLDVAGECFYRPAEFNITGNTPRQAVKSAWKQFDGYILHRSGEIRCPERCQPSILWAEILRQKPKVINLKRADTLAQTISMFAAQHSGNWQQGSSPVLKGSPSTGSKPKPFVLPFAEARKWIEQFQREYAEHDKLIADSGCQSLEVYYEDLEADWPGQLARIQEFLGVKPEPIKPATEKLHGGERSLITNYCQLRESFAGTAWSPLFCPVKPRPVSRGNRVINSLWIGSELGLMEQLTVKSFIDHGHDFHLWTYNDVDGVPAGCTLRDANEIIPEAEIFRYSHSIFHGSVAGFSDLWRFALLNKLGGWYVDTDVCCLKPFEFRSEWVLRRRNWVGTPTCNITKQPANSTFAAAVLRDTRALVGSDNIDFLLPESIIAVELARYGLQKHLVNPELFINANITDTPQPDCKPPEDRKQAFQINNAFRLSLAESEAYAVHWCSHSQGWNGLDKSKPKPGTLYERLLARHGLAIEKPKETGWWSPMSLQTQRTTNSGQS